MYLYSNYRYLKYCIKVHRYVTKANFFISFSIFSMTVHKTIATACSNLKRKINVDLCNALNVRETTRFLTWCNNA